MKRKHGIVFDFDGVLLDSLANGKERFFASVESLGLTVTPLQKNRIVECWKLGMIATAVMSECWPEVRPEEIYAAWVQFDVASPHPLYPRCKETLTALAGHGHPMLIHTNRDRVSTIHHLHAHGISGYFTYVQACWDAGVSKSSPDACRPVSEVLDRLGVSTVTYVGDSLEHDKPAAKELGARFIASGYGVTRAEDFRKSGVPDKHIILSIHELLAIIS